jgi:hypothetical protein
MDRSRWARGGDAPPAISKVSSDAWLSYHHKQKNIFAEL